MFPFGLARERRDRLEELVVSSRSPRCLLQCQSGTSDPEARLLRSDFGPLVARFKIRLLDRSHRLLRSTSDRSRRLLCSKFVLARFRGPDLSRHIPLRKPAECVYIYIYIYIYRERERYAYIYIYIYIYIFIYILYVCIYTYIHTYVYIHMYICIYTHTHTVGPDSAC